MTMRKIKVLVVPSDTFGVGLYRSVSPHKQLEKLYGDEFDVEINYQPRWTDLEFFDKYDIIHFHKGVYNNMVEFWNALEYFKTKNITTIMDIDDNWNVGQQHPLYATNKAMHIAEKILENLKKVDYVTTTTEIFAEKIRKYNKNVLVFPNSVDPEEDQYQPIKNKSDFIRFGFVMGSAHEKDMEQFKGVVNSLPKEVIDKIQIVLCGYDLRGTITMMNQDGSINSQRPIKPEESVWYTYEKIVTDNYNICSPEYKDFLTKFIKGVQWPNVENEHYRREWTKDVKDFATHYRNIDVLFAPLDCNDFNKVKSELKFIEAGFTRTAVIATDFGPYTIGSKSLFKKGGEIDPEGNCILIEPEKKHKAWAQAIKKIVNNPEYIDIMTTNMYNTIKDKYDIKVVTKNRAEWYKSIIKKEDLKNEMQ
jgi:glycosyltransferase involved in cell wall biosynthesis